MLFKLHIIVFMFCLDIAIAKKTVKSPRPNNNIPNNSTLKMSMDLGNKFGG